VSDRTLPPAGPFAGDDGSADPGLAAALADFSRGAADLRAVQHALLRARVLVPVVATASSGHHARSTGQPADPWPGAEGGTAMSTVTVVGRDGRRALPVFTSTTALSAWDTRARPVPQASPSAARAAYSDGAVALLVDPAGPVPLALEGPPMLALAEERDWVLPSEDPDVLAAVTAALVGLPGLAGVDVTGAGEADITVTLHVHGAGADGRADGAVSDPARRVAQEAADRLAAVDLLGRRLERGLDLAVVPC
jgi:hypothetical protein